MKLISKKQISWNLTKILSNINFAMFILFLILFFSMIGSIIEQNQSLSYYQINYPSIHTKWLVLDWRFIIKCGLDHIYSSWWFLIILYVLCCSLIVCTFSVQFPSLSNARRWQFIHIYNKSQIFSNNMFIRKSFTNMIYILNNQGYYTFNKQGFIYSYKGILGRISPIIVHISLIIVLLGSWIGLTTGFTAQEMVPRGEVVHLKNIISYGSNNLLPNNLVFRVDDFYIDYNNNSIQQFFSRLSFLKSDGYKTSYPVISVNSPLRFNNITFYQTDWQINALRIKLNESYIIQCQMNKMQIGKSIFWTCFLPIDQNNKILILLSKLNGDIYLYNSNGELLNIISINQKIYINQNYFQVIEMMSSTGLQIKVDPGILFVYIGFGLLMISTILSYISYSQIWFSIQDTSCYLSGSTNRAILFFEEELRKIQKIYLISCDCLYNSQKFLN